MFAFFLEWNIRFWDVLFADVRFWDVRFADAYFKAVRRELGRAKRIMSGFMAIVRRARVLEPSDEGECAWKVKGDCIYQRERSFMVYRPVKLFDLEIIELNRN